MSKPGASTPLTLERVTNLAISDVTQHLPVPTPDLLDSHIKDIALVDTNVCAKDSALVKQLLKELKSVDLSYVYVNNIHIYTTIHCTY